MVAPQAAPQDLYPLLDRHAEWLMIDANGRTFPINRSEIEIEATEKGALFGAIAENVTKALKETGIKNIHVEGLPNCDWVLIDSGDVILHVFRPEVREFYNLERLWAQNPAAAAI